MYSHSRSLVEKMKEAGKPFEFIGVNLSGSLAMTKKTVESKGLNWRSFYAGDDPTIPQAYGIRVMPTTIVIDAKGVVRSVAHGHQDEMINAVLGEMESL